MTLTGSDSHNSDAEPAIEPHTVATPEGDNEFAPDQPLKPLPGGLHKPPTIDTNDL